MCRVLVYEYYFTLHKINCMENSLCCLVSFFFPTDLCTVKSTKVSPTVRSPVTVVNYSDTQTRAQTDTHDKAIYGNFTYTIERA